MNAYIVVSHGEIATSLVAAAQRILGDTEDVVLRAVSLDWGAKPPAIREAVAGARAELPEHDQVLFLVDLVGGTPWNALKPLLAPGRSAMVGGVNLPMLIRMCCGSGCASGDLEERVEWCVSKGRQGIQPCDRSCEPAETPVPALAEPVASGHRD